VDRVSTTGEAEHGRSQRCHSPITTIISAALLLGWCLTHLNPGYARAQQTNCIKLLDFSGSVTDDALTRDWLEATLVADLEAESSHGSPVYGSFIVYGDNVRHLTAPSATSPAEATQVLMAAMGTREWGDPLAGLRAANTVPHPRCIVHITDGSIDFSPALGVSGEQYYAGLLALANQMGMAGTRVITIALTDSAAEVWGEVAVRTAGAYLVNPDTSAIAAAVAEPTPIPTTPAPPQLELIEAVTASQEGADGIPLYVKLAVPSVVLLALGAFAAALAGRRQTASGWLEIEEDVNG
jgi:hypothetical protein